jgi:DivIVA domain-containing protein
VIVSGSWPGPNVSVVHGTIDSVTLLMVLLTVAVVAGVAAVVTGAVSGGLSEPAPQVPARALPEGPLTGQDVADLRFVQAFRGYRMDQVDAAMDGLAAEIDRLRALVPPETAELD